jgi:hypothetical protein
LRGWRRPSRYHHGDASIIERRMQAIYREDEGKRGANRTRTRMSCAFTRSSWVNSTVKKRMSCCTPTTFPAKKSEIRRPVCLPKNDEKGFPGRAALFHFSRMIVLEPGSKTFFWMVGRALCFAGPVIFLKRSSGFVWMIFLTFAMM